MSANIEQQASLKGIAINTAWASLLLLILIGLISETTIWEEYNLGDYGLLVLTSFAIILAYVLVVWCYQEFKLRKRSREIKTLAEQNGWRVDISDTDSKTNRKIAVSLLAEGERRQTKNYIHAPDWVYCDYSYMVKNRGRYDSYDLWRKHYAVMSTKLPRELPHVIFDAYKSHGRQFRFYVDADQRHSLEGNFDQYFTTYFPKQYQIDSLSFITPDVMQAMISASEYDIEIYEDRLYIYGPLGDPKTQIKAMAAKLAAVKKELLDNILTYRDERLDVNIGRQTVDVKGRRLSSGKFLLMVSLVFAVLMVAYAAYTLLDALRVWLF